MPVSSPDDLRNYVLRVGDNALILGQQVSMWCGHAPALEEDIAFANVSLDLIGQATNWLNYAAELEGQSRTADDLAFLRSDREFKNVLLTEQPNYDFGHSLMRQFLFDAFHYFQLTSLCHSSFTSIADIAQKSVKEVAYHLERSSDLIIRLGDGSDESHAIMQMALNKLWRFTGELTTADSLDSAMFEEGVGADYQAIAKGFDEHTARVFDLALLRVPQPVFMASGGKIGVHSEAMGPLLAEMQHLQRAHPGASW